MRRVVFLIAILVITSCSGSSDSSRPLPPSRTLAELAYDPKPEPTFTEAKYTEEYDEFTGKVERNLQTYYGSKGQSLSSMASDSFERQILLNNSSKRGTPVTTPSSMMFFKVNNSWKYLRCNRVIFLIDGKRFEPNTTHDGEAGGGYVIEKLYVSSVDSQKLINLISNSKQSVRFKICNDEFHIPREYISDYRKFSKRI